MCAVCTKFVYLSFPIARYCWAHSTASSTSSWILEKHTPLDSKRFTEYRYNILSSSLDICHPVITASRLPALSFTSTSKALNRLVSDQQSHSLSLSCSLSTSASTCFLHCSTGLLISSTGTPWYSSTSSISFTDFFKESTIGHVQGFLSVND